MNELQENKLNKLLEQEIDMALKRRSTTIIRELDLESGDKILDAGCGPGYYLNLLTKLGIETSLYGIDTDGDVLKSAIKKLNRKNIKLVQADLMQKLPFKDGEFDKVIMSEVAEHLPNDVKGLKEVYRVLKPGGVLVLTVPNKNYPFLWDPVNWILGIISNTHVKRGVWAGIWSNHYQLYSVNEIKNKLIKLGFNIQKVRPLTWWCLPFNHNLLYGGRLPKGSYKKVLGYIQRRPVFIRIILWIINLLDQLNELFQTKQVGVNVFIKAAK